MYHRVLWKTRGPFFSFVLLPLLYSRTNQPTANKNSYERSGRAEREKRIYEVDFLQGKGAHASEISDFRLIIWSNCKNCFNILNKYENPKKMFWCVSFFVFLFFPNEYSGLCQHKPAHILGPPRAPWGPSRFRSDEMNDDDEVFTLLFLKRT